MARDRKRAKQRRQRGVAAGRRAPSADAAANGAAASSTAPVEDQLATPSGGLERADVPAALDHASADVDEFDAAIVRGAGGAPVAPDTATDTDDDFDYDTGDALQEPAGGAGTGKPGGGIGGGGTGGGRDGAGGEVARPSGAPLRGGNRAIGFLRASWAELQRVQWPDRRQVFQATAVVLGFVAIAGLYLGGADYVAKEFVEFVL
ncbi:MAG TPA: preprotein translocase subunit SecE [Solirubrobacteraceae bacterium]